MRDAYEWDLEDIRIAVDRAQRDVFINKDGKEIEKGSGEYGWGYGGDFWDRSGYDIAVSLLNLLDRKETK